ncbi:MAG: ferric reductase-like transmembrane domain-containing protein [Phycisphaerales bacterium]
MSVAYRAIQWNRHKRLYDLAIVAATLILLITFATITSLTHAGAEAISPPILAMRALGLTSLTLLHVALAIGPLARLSTRFAPLLYNRRHLGVTIFLLALLHALIAIGFYGGFGVRNPASALLDATHDYASISRFPFEILGFVAFLILFVLAATSHDFWLKNLTPRVWKSIHMLVYLAYALLVLHVALGIMQSEPSRFIPIAMIFGLATLTTLHLAAAFRQRRHDAHATPVDPASSWLDAGTIDDIEPSRAISVCTRAGPPIAVFRDATTIAAISGVCAHQGGPLAEGQILDGCITCPWHGYQYRPESGAAPPPFDDRVPTHEVRIEGRRILVNPKPRPLNDPATPAPIP